MGGIELTDLLRSFFDEAKDHLATIEQTLMALEDAPEDPELLNQIFRAAHSIKGASAICGLDGVRQLTHALEGLLQKLRADLPELTEADMLRTQSRLSAFSPDNVSSGQ